MISTVLLIVLLFLAVILQITILDLSSIGLVSIEITPLVVIYAGFRFSAIYGGVFSFLLGFFVDTIIGSPIAGLYTLIYVALFYISCLVSEKINTNNMLSLSLFTGFCFLLQGAVISFFYWLILNQNTFNLIFTVFIPQGILMGILSPFLFYVFGRLEVLLYAQDRQTDRRL